MECKKLILYSLIYLLAQNNVMLHFGPTRERDNGLGKMLELPIVATASGYYGSTTEGCVYITEEDPFKGNQYLLCTNMVAFVFQGLVRQGCITQDVLDKAREMLNKERG